MKPKFTIEIVDATRVDLLVDGGCQGQYENAGRAKAAARRLMPSYTPRLKWEPTETGFRLVSQ